MRVHAIVPDVLPIDVEPRVGRDACVRLVAAVRHRLDGITLAHRRPARSWNLEPVSAAAYLSADAGPLAATVCGLPLGLRNPVELAEQLATLDHAWGGRFDAAVVVGTAEDLAAHGLGLDQAARRFEEALGLLRAMWTQDTLTGDGPCFTFDQVQPTLRPVQDGGPPLALGVADAAGAQLAARLGLGVRLDVRPDAAARADVVDAYRAAGGEGEVSLSLPGADSQAASLEALARSGVDQVDVVVPGAATSTDELLRAVDGLADRLTAARGQ